MAYFRSLCAVVLLPVALVPASVSSQEAGLLVSVAATVIQVPQAADLNVSKVLPNGTLVDVTPGASGTFYSSTNTFVATVGVNGTVQSLSPGLVTIFVTHRDSFDPAATFIAGEIDLVIGEAGDSDGDGIEDTFELANGLDPEDPTDAEGDPDLDGLLSIEEFWLGTNPQAQDTDGDGRNDGAEIARGSDPLVVDVAALDSSWTVMVNGQFLAVASDGRFFVENIAAPDQFGAGGPGTAPDFLSDDFLRIVGFRTQGGTTQWVHSDQFQITQGETYLVGDLTLTDVPPPFPEAVRVESSASALCEGETLQVSTIGTLLDGSDLDVTSRAAGTVYRTSNPAIASVGENGLVAGLAPGTVLIVATNEGATAVKQFVVTSPSDPLTTVMGFVQLPGGGRAAGADVRISGLPFQTVAASNGSYSFTGVPTVGLPTITVRAQAIVGGSVFVGHSAAVVRQPGGLTDAGIIVLAELPCGFDEGPGSDLNQSDDDFDFVFFTQGFVFPFFGVVYDGVFVNSNGNLTFTGGNTTFNPQPIPGFVVNGLPRISLAFVDFNPAAGGEVSVSQTPDRFTVTWDDVPLFSNPGSSNTLQVSLHDTGRIDFAYNGMTANGTQQGTGADLLDISVAVSPGGTPAFLSVDYSSGVTISTTDANTAVFENFNPMNLFDLDFSCIVWEPNVSGGFDVSVFSGGPGAGTAAVSGQVVDAQGLPVPNCLVEARNSRTPGVVQSVATAAGGNFVIDDVAFPGGVTLEASVGGSVVARGSMLMHMDPDPVDVLLAPVLPVAKQ